MAAMEEKIMPHTTDEAVAEHREYDTSLASPGSPVGEEEKPRLSWQAILAILVSPD
jgi:hypothetical protein